MTKRNTSGLFTLGMDSWMLGYESAVVIGLRMTALAMGGAQAKTEAKRMVAEKLSAAQELQVKALTGTLGYSPVTIANASVSNLRRKVRANSKRLSKR